MGGVDRTEEIPVLANNTIEAEIEHFVECIAKRSVSSKSGLIGARTVEALEKMRSSMWERPLPIMESGEDVEIKASVVPKFAPVIKVEREGAGMLATPADIEHTTE